MATYTKEQFAADLNWSTKVLAPRLRELGKLETCSRCGGSGRYSYNMIDGDRCYGCNGAGVTLPKRYTKRLMHEVQAAVEGGALDAYFERNRKRNAARKAIAGLVAEAREAYKAIGDAYSEACNANGYGNVPRAIFFAQTMNNALFYGDHCRRNTAKLETMAVSEVEDACKTGKVEPEAAVAVIRERIEQIRQVANAYLARG